MPSTEESRVQMPNIEFKYIKQLQAENAELRILLEEHQAAIEMIMTKYRQQVYVLPLLFSLTHPISSQCRWVSL